MRSYSYFLNAVLFPRMLRQEIELEQSRRELSRLMKLVKNEKFLTVAIGSIQNLSQLSPTQRSKIASVLTAVLADDPEYFTKITFGMTSTFLREKANGRSPKLAFRWAESVAEKLLANWIHLGLFQDIQGETGRSLWVLLLAIKQQGWKGPIDAVRGHARYTLTETRHRFNY